MGRNFASDLTETSLTLEQQIAIHFSSNCYPPVPQFMVSVAVEAINAVNDEQYDLEIELPPFVTFNDSTTITAINAVDNLRLEAWTYNNNETLCWNCSAVCEGYFCSDKCKDTYEIGE